MPASTFSFEISEAAAMAHLDEAETFIDRIRGCGARVALGGFGSGLTSLAQLRRLRVDYLKVDGELVRGIAADRHLESMVFGLAKAAESLELATVAEHVENAVTADKLRAMGFDYGQGYFFGRPAPLEDVLAREPASL
jgi:EAL domain-containing protein (putative c-di-GMP-specific phosphodiesterase class I)